MAERIQYDPKPARIGPDAHEELERLVQTLHEKGVLRFANDLVGANHQVAQVLVNGLNQQGTLNALQNLSILGMALSRIPPEEFYKVVFAVKDGMSQLARERPSQQGDDAPGITGTWKLLQDEELWQGLLPLIHAIKAFAHGLERPVQTPITAFTGKPTEQ